MPLNTSEIRRQIPCLSQGEDYPLIYLDNAATTQKPQIVIDAITSFYTSDNANVHRGMHILAEKATDIYEAARTCVRQFINAQSDREIIFTKNATEGINLVARSFGEIQLQKGDVVLLSLLEHHSNIVPWLQLKEKVGIEIEWIQVTEEGEIDLDAVRHTLSSKNVRLVSITCVSNVLGITTPYKEITALAHEHGALCLLDAAQLAPHSSIDVQDIDCDFLVFSGHKIYGPTGIGVLFGKEELLQNMPPFLGGGSMIQEVFTDHFTPLHLPDKFEAGTPPIAQAHGLCAALEWLNKFSWEDIQQHEEELLTYALEKFKELPFVDILGPKGMHNRAGCISFTSPPVHPHDLTEYMGRKGVCLRAGHHCAQPLHDFLGCPATSRLSVALYNEKSDIDRVCKVLEESYVFFTKKH